MTGDHPEKEPAGSRRERMIPLDDPARQRGVEWIRRMAAGDQQALAAFYDAHAVTLYSLALKMTKDEKDAEDAVQDAIIYIWRKASTYDSQLSSPFSWAVMILRNKAIDRIRSRHRVERIVERATAEWLPLLASEDESADETTSREQRSLVRAALQRLPGEQRQAVELAFFSGLTHEEIATHLAAPLGTIKARIRRGLIRLRKLVSGAR